MPGTTKRWPIRSAMTVVVEIPFAGAQATSSVSSLIV